MRHLELLIIGAAIGEGQYKTVEFLEPKDFNHYSVFWEIAKYSKGDLIQMCKAYPEDKHGYFVSLSNAVISTNLQGNAIKLVELRFERLLDVLICSLSKKTKNPLESKILEEIKNSIYKVDIFDLGDNILEYIGHQVSFETESRIKSYLGWRDDRVKQIKQYEPSKISK